MLFHWMFLQPDKAKGHLTKKIFPYSLWKVNCPLKIIIFSWLVYHNKNFTWTNFQKRGWQGPAICSICSVNTEDNLHIFLKCLLSQSMWMQMATYSGFPTISHPSMEDAYEWWGSQKTIWRPIPLIICWFIWKWRNKTIFQNCKESFGLIIDKVIPFYFSILHNNPQQKKQQLTTADSQQLFFPRAHFDGAAKDGICACGVYIGISNDLQYYLYWNGSNGTNNKAEAMALHGLLLFCIFMDIGPINVFGDSKIIIDHTNSKHVIKNDSVSGWLARIASLWKPDIFPISHIKLNQNEIADVLSKKGMQSPVVKWQLNITMESSSYVIQHFSMPGI